MTVVEGNAMSYTSTLVLVRVLPFCCCSCFSLEISKFELHSSIGAFYFRCGFSGLIALLFFKFLFVMVAEKNVMCRWKVMLERLIWERP